MFKTGWGCDKKGEGRGREGKIYLQFHFDMEMIVGV
jgi:hypothetical protein